MDEFINTIIGKRVLDDISETKKGLTDIVELIARISTMTSSSSDKFSTAKGVKDYSAALEESIKINEKKKEALTELEKAEKKYAEQQQKLIDITNGATDAAIKQAIILKQAKQEREAMIKQQLAEVGSYDQLSAKYSEIKLKLNAMSDAERQNTKAGKEMEQEASAIMARMKELQESTGKNTLSVGDYGIAVKSVREQLRETREAMAALIQSGKGIDNPEVKALAVKMDELNDTMTQVKNTSELMDKAGKFQGFVKSLGAVSAAFEVARGASALFGDENKDLQKVMLKVQATIAMSHGLEILGNSLKKESTVMLFLQMMGTKALTAAHLVYNTVVGTSIGLMKMLRIAIAMTGVGLLVLGLIELVKWLSESTTNIKDFETAVSDTNASVKDLNDALKKTGENAEAAADSYAIATGKMTQADKDYKDSYKTMNEAMLDIVSKRNIATNNIEEEYKSAIQKRSKEYLENGYSAEEGYSKAIVDLTAKYANKKLAVLKTAQTALKNITSQYESETKTIIEEENKEKLEKEKKANEDAIKAAVEHNKTILELTKKHRDDETSLMKDGIEKDLLLLKNKYDDEIAGIDALKITSAEKLKAKADAEEIYKAQEVAITEKYNAIKLKEEEDYYTASIAAKEKMTAAYKEEYEKDIAFYESVLKLKHAGDKDSLDFEKELIELKIEANKNRYEQGFIDESDYLTTLNNLKADSAKNEVNQAQKVADEKKKITEANVAAIGGVLSAAQSVIDFKNSTATESLKSEYDKQLAALQEQKDLGILTETQFNKKKKALDNELSAEEGKLRHKKDLMDRGQAIFNATIAMNEAIIKATTAGPVIGQILAGMTAAFNGKLLFDLISTPLPKYKFGREGGKAEFAITGDDGVELLEHKGKFQLTPDKPTLTFLPEGAKVHSNKKLMKMLYENPNLQNGFAENMFLSSSLESAIREENSMTREAIKNKQELHIIGSLESGISYIYKSGNNYINYISNKLLN